MSENFSASYVVDRASLYQYDENSYHVAVNVEIVCPTGENILRRLDVDVEGIDTAVTALVHSVIDDETRKSAVAATLPTDRVQVTL